MSKYVNPCKVITGPNTRWSYANVWEAKSINGGAPKYSVSLIIPKTDTVTYQDILNSIEAAAQTATNGKTWNGVRPPIILNPLHDGDGVRQDGTPYGPECKGMWVMTASRRAQDGKPWVCDISNPRVELAPQDAYSGMYARCTVHFFGYLNSGKKGIGCSLDGVMKTRDGDSLGGAVAPSANEFAQFAGAVNPVTGQATGTINPITGQPM